MPDFNLNDIFVERRAVPGATDEELASLASSLGKPLSSEEVAKINASQRNPFPATDPLYARYRPFDPREWRLPQRPLPDSYLTFLRCSNGGEFCNGERLFQMLSASEMRDVLLCYHIPQYMPDVISFAFDGYGSLYLFDMREAAISGEYPIVLASAGNLCFDEAEPVGASFIDVLKSQTNGESS